MALRASGRCRVTTARSSRSSTSNVSYMALIGAPRPAGDSSAALIALHEHRDALADTHAQGGQAPAGVLPLQPADQREQDAGAGTAEGMAERDGTAVGVDLLLVELQPPHHRECLRGERLVQLDGVQVAALQASRARAFSVAGTGPSPIRFGCTPAEAAVRIRARGVSPYRSTAAALATTSAAAPSDNGEEEPAVTMPSGRRWSAGCRASPGSYRGAGPRRG